MNPGGNLANSSLPVPVAHPTPVLGYRMAGPLGSRIFLGLLVATIGVALQAGGSAIPFLSSYGSNSSLPDFIRRMWIEAIIGAFGIAIFAIGLFLAFWSIARVRQVTRPWTAAAAFVVLPSGLVGAVFRVLYVQVWWMMFSGPIAQIAPLFSAVGLTQLAAGFALTLAILVGLFGVARPFVSL